MLVLRHPRPVEREWLAGTLWPDSEQSRSLSNLRVALSELRSALASEGRRLQSPDRHTLVLDLTDASVDVLRFDSAVASGKLFELKQAVALYRGPLLEGCIEEWVFQERTAREQDCLKALQKLGDSSLVSADYVEAAGYYQQAVRIDPWQEAARRGWMEALARSGDINAALQVYREFIAFLKDDPKAVPDDKTTALYQRLREEARQKTETHALASPEPLVVPVIKGYLPHPITALVGREDERIEVAIRLRKSRLVTLTGMGGIGKTRLAREIAGEVVRHHPDGVWLVALESLSDGGLVARQIASVLGLKEELGKTPLDSVTEHLRAKRVLLVIDNCEHVLDACARIVDHLLRECGELRILATSREAFGITGETAWSVPALAAPDTEHLPQGTATLLRVLMGYESVQLFVERAQAIHNSFSLDEGNARTVARVCRSLEGIPLAIELAAARVKTISVEQIASRLDNHLGLLTVGSRTAAARQQTMRGAIDWSYTLLTEPERTLLQRLSVFAGGWTLEAAETVCDGDGISKSQVPDLLGSLVDKSLTLFEEQDPAGARYRLLETVRQYAAAGLQASGDMERVRARHRDWFLALAEAAEPQLKGAEQAGWLQRLETDHDNLRAALAFCETKRQGAQEGLRLASALFRFWNMRGEYYEGRAYLGRALEREGAHEATPARAMALNRSGDLAEHQGDYAPAVALCQEGLAISRELGIQGEIAASLNSLGEVARKKGDYPTARALLEESLAIRRELRDQDGIVDTLNNLGIVAFFQNENDVARSQFEESLAISRELGDKAGIARSLNNLGNLAYSLEDDDAARMLYEESLAIRRELAEKQGIANALGGLANVAYSSRDYETARTLFEENLAILQELGDKARIANTFNCIARVDLDLGNYAAARTRLQESLAISREIRHSFTMHTLGSLGHLDREVGDYARAAAFYQESLRMRRDMEDKLAIAQSMEDFAGLAGRQGQFARAVRLLGAAEALCESIGRTLPVAMVDEFERTVVGARAALSEEAFARAWDKGRLMSRDEAVAFALEEVADATMRE